jgi:hypothetical protein
MKPSFALLAGLLAGLSLGALDRAQPLPTLVSAAHAQEEEEEEWENPMKGANRKQIKCVLECQEPFQRCVAACGNNGGECMDRCGQRQQKCTKACDVDPTKKDKKGKK